MTTTELLRTLDLQDRKYRIWLFTNSMLRALFPEESEASLKMSLRRHVASGIVRRVAQGLYANERALSMQRHAVLEAMIPYLRPRELNYISQESRLSQLGAISQITGTHLTVMTTGRSQRVKTPYGTLEFTHTKRDPGKLLKKLSYDKAVRAWVADPGTAYRDLKLAQRNLGMVDMDELDELLSEAEVNA